jgi:hypothetical protein
MTTRTFVFCDVCNPEAIRAVEPQDVGLTQNRRRITDERVWLEGALDSAVCDHGWYVTTDGAHICPHCRDGGVAVKTYPTVHAHSADSGRQFIFCDCCNPMAIRYVEQRRSSKRAAEGTGRRVTDNRAWFDGVAADAVEAGWAINTDGSHYCPTCLVRHLDEVIEAA